jgi:transposase InsO family protein
VTWKESNRVDERMKFITRLDGGERMTDLCLEFGISRKTGYKIWNRYQEIGAKGIFDQSRKPHYLARETRQDIQELIVEVKREHQTWGATKIRDFLHRNHPGLKLPVRATVHAVLDKHGLVKPRRKRDRRVYPGASGLTEGIAPNLVWSADYKGQFKMKNGQYCYPLTIADHCTRFLLGCEALENTQTSSAQRVFTEIFEQYGLPECIRSDNGAPFASAGLLGLSRLAVWWMRLDINVEHTEPGHPQQNGRHERMHLTLKQDVKIGANLLQQQERLDDFQDTYNNFRSHESLGLKRPSELYKPSMRKLPRFLEPLEYPDHEYTKKVDGTGRIYFPKSNLRIFLSGVLAGENIGLNKDDDNIWRVTFKNLDLGFVDLESGKFSSAQIAKQQTKVLPMSQD